MGDQEVTDESLRFRIGVDDQFSAPLAKLQGALMRIAKDDSVHSFKQDWTEVGRAVEKVGGVPGAGARRRQRRLRAYPGRRSHAAPAQCRHRRLVDGGASPARRLRAGEGRLSELGTKALVARWSAVEARSGPTSVHPRSGAFGIAQFRSKSGGYSRLRDDEVVNDFKSGPPGRAAARRIGDEMMGRHCNAAGASAGSGTGHLYITMHGSPTGTRGDRLDQGEQVVHGGLVCSCWVGGTAHRGSSRQPGTVATCMENGPAVSTNRTR
ncbi:hypothetical protein M446_5565 [Methylobacterium sp. 4-46]|uniref:hypothetical protein n=1 Tax=unclassified Methylobacterium TaxID=2615210 RepID=UPI000152E609|nr:MULTISPECIES: hypothetical protein [Methylobacterium]ACA19872.1 hypothetical protein M446_5565 [Methylobacterium sp. 4-46]WFT79055.1 hypothetical protein QA634_28055 [Methylobacterium nodulans]